MKKVQLSFFADIEECQEFVNGFSEVNTLVKVEIKPLIIRNKINYFVHLEYETN